MTILSSLARRYDQLAATGEAPIPGYAPAQISFVLILAGDGTYVETQDDRVGTGTKLRPTTRTAPAAPKRTVGIASGAFWDKTSYVFGRTALDTAAPASKQAREAKRLADVHAAFLARHEALLDGVDDAGCAALLAFLRNWSPERYDALEYAEAMLDQNVAFRLQGESGFIHDRPAARAALIAEAGARDGGPEAMCLVTGMRAPVARLHPSIKGVVGAQAAGAALVSFNLESFTSYGKSQGANAPVSEAAAFAYATALNGLLSPSGNNAAGGRPFYRNRIMLGDTTVVFWAEHGDAEALARAMLVGEQQREEAEEEDTSGDALPVNADTETTKLHDVLKRMRDGKPLSETLPQMHPDTRIYVLGLSPNAARLSVRFWVVQSLEEFARNFQLLLEDLRLEPKPHPWPPPLWRLLLELAPQRKAENIPPQLNGEMMRAILTGLPFPRAVLSQLIMRIRADRDEEDRRTGRKLERISDLRVVLLKAYLARMHRWKLITEEVPVSLDLASINPAYRLGRLFSLLEFLQQVALRQRNATIRDRFYASASATPAFVFPSLIRNARNHSKVIRTRYSTKYAETFEERIAEILSGLEDSFPKVLTVEDQGRFALGYYHQRDVFRSKKDVLAEVEATDDTDDTADTDNEET